jgi:AcrR family transcriptional regulator
VAERNPKATRDRILKAATREFAAKGVAGARVDAIAARAKANKRMLYHYFGSKADLFREVLRRELTERVDRSRERGGTRLERLVDRQATHARDREWVRLLLWEGLDPRTAAASDPERERWYAEWVEGMRADQEAGLLPADLDVAQLALSELALTMFPAAFPQLTRWITGRPVTDPVFVAERQAFLAALGSRIYGSV